MHAHFGELFPNLPAIDASGRYSLAWLAVGDECPSFTFFIGLKENVPQVRIDRFTDKLDSHFWMIQFFFACKYFLKVLTSLTPLYFTGINPTNGRAAQTDF